MTDKVLDLSRRCEEAARHQAALSREVLRVGSFEALIDTGDDLVWLNYAVPVAPLDSDLEVNLAELRAYFGLHNRRLRFEFHAALWPDLAAVLEKAGLIAESHSALMVCDRDDLRVVAAPGVRVQLLDDHAADEDLAAVIEIQRAGFGESAGVVSAERLLWMRNMLRAGYERYGLARLDDAPAGAAAVLPFAGTGELAGVATLPSLRRRGVAATLCSAMVTRFFATGGELAWLSAGGAAAESAYAHVGFRHIDDRLSYIDPGTNLA